MRFAIALGAEVGEKWHVRDKSVPVSALTNTNDENMDPFASSQLGMMISHPSGYAAMIDTANRATGDDKKVAEAVVENMRHGLIPKGPARMFSTGPEWSTRLNWSGSNPGNLRGFRTKWTKERLAQIRFLDVTTSMLPSGIPFPVIPESPEIMNIIVPAMLQNALAEKMTVADAADQAARQIEDLMSGL
jgi:multiple sugar transport system substrate-binding protein